MQLNKKVHVDDLVDSLSIIKHLRRVRKVITIDQVRAQWVIELKTIQSDTCAKQKISGVSLVSMAT